MNDRTVCNNKKMNRKKKMNKKKKNWSIANEIF